MSLITEEIANARTRLGLSASDIQLLPPDKNKKLYFELLQKFVDGGDRKWWWEAFKEEAESRNFEDGMGFKKLPELVPNPNEKLWFVAEEAQLGFYPIYETTAKIVTAVIGECYGFEYYLVPNNMSWLICENHHNRIVAIGNDVKNKLREVAV